MTTLDNSFIYTFCRPDASKFLEWLNEEIVMDNKRKSELLKFRFYSLLANFKKDIENMNS